MVMERQPIIQDPVSYIRTVSQLYMLTARSGSGVRRERTISSWWHPSCLDAEATYGKITQSALKKYSWHSTRNSMPIFAAHTSAVSATAQMACLKSLIFKKGSGRHCGPWTRRDLLGKTPGVLQCGCGMERTLNRVMKRPRVGLSRSDRRKNTRWVINWLAKRVRGMCQRLSRLTRTAVFTDGCQRRRVSELHFIQVKTATGAKVQRSRSKAIALGLTCWRQSRCCPHTIARPLQPFN